MAQRSMEEPPLRLARTHSMSLVVAVQYSNSHRHRHRVAPGRRRCCTTSRTPTATAPILSHLSSGVRPVSFTARPRRAVLRGKAPYLPSRHDRRKPAYLLFLFAFGFVRPKRGL